MKLPDINILDEDDKVLRTKSFDVLFPLSEEDKKLISDSLDYLEIDRKSVV